jgi:beta-glucosidase
MDLLPPPGTPGQGRNRIPFDIDYNEGLKVGYKWFQAEGKEPLFAFGVGLSYTTFAYSDLKVSMDSVTFTVRNTGKRSGAEVAQVYVALPAAAQEPPKRLVAWEKFLLAPGESKTRTVHLEPKLLSIFDVSRNDWRLPAGEYRIFVGGSSSNTPLTGAARNPADR